MFFSFLIRGSFTARLNSIIITELLIDLKDLKFSEFYEICSLSRPKYSYALSEATWDHCMHVLDGRISLTDRLPF